MMPFPMFNNAFPKLHLLKFLLALAEKNPSLGGKIASLGGNDPAEATMVFDSQE